MKRRLSVAIAAASIIAPACVNSAAVLKLGPIVRVQVVELGSGAQSVTVKAGATIRIGMLGYDDANYQTELPPDSWTSRDARVATVSGGTVTTSGPGVT